MLTGASYLSSCSAFQTALSFTKYTNNVRAKQFILMSGDDFFDGYDEFVSNLDFNDDGWNMENRIDNRGGGKKYNDQRGGRRKGGNRDFSRDSYNGYGHDYERARDDDISSCTLDVDKVNELIGLRLGYRKRGDFDQADDVRDALFKDFGVTLWDRDKIWTTNRNRRGGSNRHSGNGRYSGERSRGQRGQRSRGPRKDFGPRGHDYEQAGDQIDPAYCTLTEPEIDSLLAERLQAKMSRDFDTADEIQKHLKDQGVLVMDGFKQWRADGKEWERSQRAEWQPGPNMVREYSRRGPCHGIPEDEVAEITEKIRERSEFKAFKDYDSADAIKFDLSDKYDITIDDKMMTWAIRAEEYLLSNDSYVVPDEEVQKIIGKELGLRIVAKQNKDFDAADAIRNDLNEKYGVVINDRRKEYAIEPNENHVDNSADSEGWFNNEIEEVSKNKIVSAETENIESNDDYEESLQSLTIPILKEKLRSAGLPVSGKKAELIERLMANQST